MCGPVGRVSHDLEDILSTADLQPRASGIISREVRWLVAATACLTALAGFRVLGVFILIPNFLMIVGAMMSGYFPRCGKYLIWCGAIIMSLELLPMGLLAGAWLLRSHPLPLGYLAILADLSLVVLLVCCDIALFVEPFQNKNNLGAGKSLSHMLELLVWITVVVMNCGLLPNNVLSWISNRDECAGCYEKPIAELSVLAIVLLDAILVFNVLKTKRVRHESKA